MKPCTLSSPEVIIGLAAAFESRHGESIRDYLDCQECTVGALTALMLSLTLLSSRLGVSEQVKERLRLCSEFAKTNEVH